MDFPPNATINTSYSGTCNATASPRPHVYVTVSSDGCLYTTNIVNTSKYTTEVKVIIPQVTARCRNAIITCHAYQITEQFTLNVTESKSITMHTHTHTHTHYHSRTLQIQCQHTPLSYFQLPLVTAQQQLLLPLLLLTLLHQLTVHLQLEQAVQQEV